MFYETECAESESVFECGVVFGESFSACYRSGSCWMKAAFVGSVGELPAETQYLLAKKSEGVYTLYFMLCDGAARCSLFSQGGKAYVRAETGDSGTPLGKFRYMYALDCTDPYAGIELAYREMRAALGTFLLKKEKKSSSFIDHFGYCTYNAFGSDVTHDNILAVEKSFCEQDVKLGFLIADEGWMIGKDGKLASFYANPEKFPYGLGKTVEICKQEYGLKKFFCWHTYSGYWKGLDSEVFTQYAIVNEPFGIPDRLRSDSVDQAFSATAGDDFYPMNIADQESGICYKNVSSVYRDFYLALKEQKVDGTKIDAMTWSEAFAEGRGGRVNVMKKLLRAIESASDEVFDGEHINCSSCSNDFFMNIGTGTVTRTSCDYMPDKPLTHGAHVQDNAFVGFWVQPIVTADWDMFESGSEWGEYHAAARSVSGGPVYCTDRPEKIDYALIRKLCTKEGKVFRCEENAKPTENCLFGTPVGEPFRIFNRTKHGDVLAAFGTAECKWETQLALSEINGLEKGTYAVYSSRKGFIGIMTESDCVGCDLKARNAEIFTVVKVQDGCAVLGMVEKLNPSAYIKEISVLENSVCVMAAEVGKIGVYTEENGYREYFGDHIFVTKQAKEEKECS